MRPRLLLLACALLPWSPALANTTRLYLRMSGGALSLSATAPVESPGPGNYTLCAGGNGCVVVPAGASDGICNGERSTLSPPVLQFRYVVSQDWGKDSSLSTTGFRYWANLKSGEPSFTQPKMQVTYLYPAGTPSVEVFGSPCAACGGPGCPISTGTIVQLDKTLGGNISLFDDSLSPPLGASLPAGSTILVEVWGADGLGDGILHSSTPFQSYIDVPYSKDNFSVKASITPGLMPSGATRTFTYTLDNTDPSAPNITRLDLSIPGALGGVGLYFGQVNVLSVTKPLSTTTVVQASGSGPGTLTVDFTANPVTQETVVITFSAVAPVSPVQNVQWAGSVATTAGSVLVSEISTDSSYTAVLDPPGGASAITVVPVNTAGGGGQLQLNWSGPTPVTTAAVTVYQVFRGTSASTATTLIATVPPQGVFSTGSSGWKPGITIVTQASGLSFTDGGLVNGQLYSYVLRACNPVGQSALSVAVSDSPYAEPGAVVSLSTLTAGSAISLAWTPVAAGTYAVAGYQIFRTSTGGVPTFYSTVASPTATVYADPGVVNGTAYQYEVRAYDAGGHLGGLSPIVTGQPPVTPPAGLTALWNLPAQGVSLQWQPSIGDAFPISGYNVYRGTCATCLALFSRLVNNGAGPPTTTTFTDTAVAVAKTYHYAVTALSTEGATSTTTTEGSRTATVRILVPPAPPFGLTISPSAGAALYLKWSLTSNATGNVNTYRVYRATFAGSLSPTQVASFGPQSATEFTNNGLASGQRYFYRVTALVFVNPDLAESAYSTETSLPVEPSAVQNFIGAANDSIVRLRWDDLQPAQEVQGYKLYRSTVAAFSNTLFLASVSTSYYDDTTAVNAVTYVYWIKADNPGGSGPYTTLAGQTPYVPPGPPGTPVAASGITKVTLGWAAAAATSYPVSGYWLYRGTYTGGEGLVPINPFGALITATYFTDSGLANGTTYFYTVVAEDSAGHPSLAGGEGFATPAIPPCPPATLTALPFSGQVDLVWAGVSATTCAASPTLPVGGYRIYRSTTSLVYGAPLATVASATTYTYSDLTAVNGTTYYYAVRAFDTGAPPNESIKLTTPFNPVYSPEAEATPRVPAAAPGGLTVQGEPNEHDTMLKLVWVPSVPGSLPVQGYNLYRSTRIGAPETLFYIPGGIADSYLDTGLTNKKFYYYRVAPLEAGGFEGNWAAVTGTPFTDANPPGSPAVTEGNTQMVVQWTVPAATSYPVSGYRVSRATWPGIVSLPFLSGPGVDPFYGTVFTDSGLVNGTTYFYHVQTYDNQRHLEHTYSAEVSGTPYALPSAPLGLTLASGNARITVSWNAAAPGTYAVTGYQVFRATYTGATCGSVPLVSVSGGLLSYVDTAMTNNGTFYFYTVAAVDAVSPTHLSACSGEQSASPFATVDPPGKPNNLTGSAGSGQVLLSWLGGSPSPPQVVSGYSVFRTTYAGNPATPVEFLGDTVSTTTVAYSDITAVNGTVYYYRVRTRDDAYTIAGAATSYSQSSNEASAFPAEVPSGLVATPAANQVALAWSPVAVPAGPLQCTGYAVYRSTGATGPFAFIGNTANDRLAAAYTDTAVSAGLTVFYRVLARHEAGWRSGLSAASGGAAATGPPSSPALTGAAGDKVVVLGWTVATGGVTPTTSYQVWRATTAGGPWANLGTPLLAPQLSYTDTGGGVANGTPYYYQVAALDSGPPPSVSTYSNPVYALPLGTPVSLSAVPFNNHISLTWQVSANGTAGTSGYLVYRMSPTQAEGITGTVFGPLNTTFFDATAAVGVFYTYRVRAFDQVTPPTMTGLFSNTASGTPVTPPNAPNITSLTASFRRIDLQWAPPSPPGGTFAVSGYKLFRSSGGGPAAYLGTFPLSVTTYADVGVTNGVTWGYTMVAFDAGVPPNDSVTSSPPKCGTPFDLPLPPFGLTMQPAGSGKLLIQWSVTATQTTFPVAGYNLYRGTTPNGEGFAPVNFLLVGASYYTDTGLVNGTTYFYKVRALDIRNNLSTTSLEGAGTPFNPAPAPLGLSALPGNQIVMLTWSAAGAGTYPVSGYMVYRGPATNTEVFLAGPVFATIYTDATVVNGTPYFYTVTARDAQGAESPPSNEATTTPLAALVNPPQAVAYSIGGSGITLSWTGTYAGTQVPTGYLILRSTCAVCGVTSSVYVAAGVFSYLDTVIPTGGAVTYMVRAVVTPNVLESADVPGRSIVAIANACSPPGAPGSLAATAGSGAVSLTWTAAPSACALLGYNVYRNGVLLAGMPISNLAYVDTGLANGTAYTYRVTAVSAGGEGAAATAVATPGVRPNGAFLVRNAVAPVRGERVEISFTLEKASDVTVRVYTIAGLKVFEGKNAGLPAGPAIGSYIFAGPDGLPGWDGKAADAQYVSSGVYVIDVEAGSFHKQLKTVVVK